MLDHEDSDMKPTNTKAVVSKTLLAWIMGLCLLVSSSATLWAQDESYEGGDEDFQSVVEGPFDGVDLKARRIWVNDTVYVLDRAARVEGTSTKLGYISDLKAGEVIRVTLTPNEKTPSIPNVILIERL